MAGSCVQRFPDCLYYADPESTGGNRYLAFTAALLEESGRIVFGAFEYSVVSSAWGERYALLVDGSMVAERSATDW